MGHRHEHPSIPRHGRGRPGTAGIAEKHPTRHAAHSCVRERSAAQLVLEHAMRAYAATERVRALEEAARVCDGLFTVRAAGGFIREATAARSCAALIRELVNEKGPRHG